MATIEHVETHVGTQTRLHTWSSMTESDIGEPVNSPAAAEKSIQVEGTFGAGSVPIEGSIDGSNYHSLYDVTNTLIEPTAAGIFTIRDNVRYIRPGTPTGSSVSVTVSLLHKQV